jgi:hypothetical protein
MYGYENTRAYIYLYFTLEVAVSRQGYAALP